MIKFIEFLILGYLIYILLRNVFGRFFISQGKQAAGSFRQSEQTTYNPYHTSSSGQNEYSGKKYGATKVDHIPQEENISHLHKTDDGEYIDYKEVK